MALEPCRALRLTLPAAPENALMVAGCILRKSLGRHKLKSALWPRGAARWRRHSIPCFSGSCRPNSRRRPQPPSHRRAPRSRRTASRPSSSSSRSPSSRVTRACSVRESRRPRPRRSRGPSPRRRARATPTSGSTARRRPALRHSGKSDGLRSPKMAGGLRRVSEETALACFIPDLKSALTRSFNVTASPR